MPGTQADNPQKRLAAGHGEHPEVTVMGQDDSFSFERNPQDRTVGRPRQSQVSNGTNVHPSLPKISDDIGMNILVSQKRKPGKVQLVISSSTSDVPCRNSAANRTAEATSCGVNWG
jgi:hypothetical protein